MSKNYNYLQYTDINILNYIKYKMPSNTDIYDTRKDYINKFYKYIHESLKEKYFEIYNRLFDIAIRDIKFNELQLNLELIYETHLKIINLLLNYIIYEKYDVYKTFNITTDDKLFRYDSTGLISLKFMFDTYDGSKKIYKLSYTINYNILKSTKVKELESISNFDLLYKPYDEIKEYQNELAHYNESINVLDENIQKEIKILKTIYDIRL